MNKKTFKNKRKAFSLIELSIVLIIIGLLVAGVTGGASLIRNAELRGIMTEARGFETAVQSFYTKFEKLPGDFGKAIGALGVAGDEDSIILYFDDTADVLEANNALQHLINGSFIDANGIVPGITALDGSGFDYDQNPGGSSSNGIPETKIDNIGWTFGSSTVVTGADNYVILTGSTTAETVTMAGAGDVGHKAEVAISGQDALSMDTKLDDGVYNTGSVIGIVPETAVTGSCDTGYTLTDNDTITCALGFNIDPTTN